MNNNDDNNLLEEKTTMELIKEAVILTLFGFFFIGILIGAHMLSEVIGQ